MADEYDFDLFVIGAGSGGVRAGRLAALAGERVGMAEEYRIGGTCVIRGCVPKKFMVYASQFRKTFEAAKGFGWSMDNVRFDWPRFQHAMSAEVDRLSGIYMRNLANAGVEVIEERAEFVDDHTLRLVKSGREVTAGRILIATGGTPWRPDDLPGVERTITSNEIFHLKQLPKHLVIAGGGYIACEFAHVFAGLGVEICLVYRGETVLNGFDFDIRTEVHEGLKRAGVRVITHAIFKSIEDSGDPDLPHRITLDNGDEITADVVMMAVGREPATHGLNCEAAGVELGKRGAVIVDEHSRTSKEHIFAVGDVINKVQLTPVAIREGHALADTLYNDNPWTFEYDNIATAVFTQPEVGTVGMSEAEARAAHTDIDIYKTRFKPMKSALSGDDTRTMMKLVVRASDEKILGVHMVGPDSAEMIQAIGIAVKKGVTKPDFDRTCAVHPTAAEELVTMRQKFIPEAAAG